jgi:tRNA-2-methylthio-N6-dimethylallyladenosine synthase
MMPELQEILKSGKIPYICSAAQSGNNRVLKIMKRGYKIEDFKEAIRVINKNFSNIEIRTQLMTGFPSETDEEFLDTFKLLDEIDFDFVEVYNFEPRPGTKAADMQDQVPKKIATRRYHKLLIKSFFHMCNSKRKKKKISNR